MKVSLGMKLRSGPWGGGNAFGRALADYLRDRGEQVFFDLRQPDLDIILLTDPRPQSASASYRHREIIRYLLRRNRRALVVHRVNECDERKGTRGVNRMLLQANRCADHTVFVSSWLRDLFVRRGIPCPSCSVICNGSDTSVFHARGYERWDGKPPLKLVSHHWSGNWMKGFDIYERLDMMLASEPLRSAVSFTYIGNVPRGFTFRHSRHVPAVADSRLADLIRQHHVYLTASLNEPGSNHQNEGACCGLPLLYRHSGCLPEYCHGFGIAFTEADFDKRLQEMAAAYHGWADRMDAYPHTAGRMCDSYYRLFADLAAERDRIIAGRTWRYRPFWLARTLMP